MAMRCRKGDGFFTMGGSFAGDAPGPNSKSSSDDSSDISISSSLIAASRPNMKLTTLKETISLGTLRSLSIKLAGQGCVNTKNVSVSFRP
jgi:hypothetical protein